MDDKKLIMILKALKEENDNYEILNKTLKDEIAIIKDSNKKLEQQILSIPK